MVESKNMSKQITRIFIILILVVVGFHASGVEMAFCDEAGSSVMGQAHGCVVCQPSHHTFTAQKASIDFPSPSVTFLNQQQPTLPAAEPASLFFRPPISL